MRNTELLLATWFALSLPFATALPSPAAEGTSKAVSTESSEKITDPTLPSCFGELTEHPLPEGLGWARDIRWLGKQEVAISALRRGVVRLRLDRSGKSPFTEMTDGGRRSASGSPWSLATSERYMVVGASMFAVGWKTREATDLEKEDYFEFTWDLDLHKDRLLVLGVRKNAEGTGYEEEGAYVWLGALGESNLDTMRPLVFSAGGGHGHVMGGCETLFIGAARFLEDGSFVVVPITEPGVFHFRANGRLARTWKSEEFGLDGGCGLSKEHIRRIGIDLDLRMDWINRRRIVDDILPLGGDRFGLLVRRHRKGITHWQMEIVSAQGRLGACEIPLAVPNRWVHLRADRRGERVALLQIVRFDSLQSKGPIIPPHLLVAPLTGALADGPSSPHPSSKLVKDPTP